MNNNEFTTKNDFLFFKDEILGDIKKIELSTSDKFSKISSYLENQKEYNEKKYKELEMSIENLSKKIKEKTDLERLEDKLEKSIKTLKDLNTTLDIKLNILNKDLKDTCFKYDKIISNNLFVPGVVGIGCPYENMRFFIEYANIKLSELIKTKDKNNLDNKSYKERMEGIIKQNTFQFETMENKFTQLIKIEVNKYDEMCRQRIVDVYTKLEKDKSDNNKVIDEQKLNLDKLTKDFDKFYYEDWANQNKLCNSLNRKLGKNKDEFNSINNKLKELDDLIKKINSNSNNYIRKSNAHTFLFKQIQEKYDTNISDNEKLNNKKSNNMEIKKIAIRNQKYNITPKDEIYKENISYEKIGPKTNHSFNKKINDINITNENNIIPNNKEKSEKKKKANNEIIEINNNKENTKSRNKKSIDKKSNISDIQDTSVDCVNNNNKVFRKLDFKSLNIKKRKFNKNINENNKIFEYDDKPEKNDKKEQTYENNSFYFKVINYNGIINGRNKSNNNKTTKNHNFGQNYSYSSIEPKNKYKKNYNISEKVKLNHLVIGSEFREKDLHFINQIKFNLSQAYLLEKARLEKEQRKQNNLFSTNSFNNNKIKPFDKNKFNLYKNNYKFKNEKINEKERAFDRNIQKYNDNQEIMNSNFPSIYTNIYRQGIKFNNNLENKKMYLSYMNDYMGNKANIFNKDANRTQIIDENMINDNKNKNVNLFKKNKRIYNKKLLNSSSDIIPLIKKESKTPDDFSKHHLNYSNNYEKSFDLSYDNRNGEQKLKKVKSYLIKKLKEDLI